MKEHYRRIHVTVRDDWYKNPLTWILYGLAVVIAFGFNSWLALIPALLIFPTNLNVEYESTKSFNTNPNKVSDTDER